MCFFVSTRKSTLQHFVAIKIQHFMFNSLNDRNRIKIEIGIVRLRVHDNIEVLDFLKKKKTQLKSIGVQPI